MIVSQAMIVTKMSVVMVNHVTMTVSSVAVGVSSVAVGVSSVAVDNLIDDMSWSVNNFGCKAMIKDGVSMGESVRVSAGDGQSVIYTGAGGRVGGIMSLEVVLLVLMIFGSVIVEDSVVVSLVMDVVVVLLDVFVMVVNMIVDIVDVLVQVGVVMVVSREMNDVVVDMLVAFI